jgi:thiamine-monophosphate kinase
MQIGEIGEFDLIERLLAQSGLSSSGVVLGPGDDAAALTPSPGALLLATCDSQVEGQHFQLGSRGTPEQLGRRLAAVNLSDIAAMGGQPRWALVSLSLPADTPAQFLEQVYQGLAMELKRFDASVVGGNVARSDRLVFEMTLLGEISPPEVLRRNAAQPGDAVLVTGTLGASAAGRAALDAGAATQGDRAVIERHLAPEPRVAAGRSVAASRLAHAMIDVSDGFAQDLGHICDASACGVAIDASSIPIGDETRQMAHRLNADALTWALHGGEDYELIITVPEDRVPQLVRTVEWQSGVPLTRVGTILDRTEGRWLVQDGRKLPLSSEGWQHFGKSSR